VSIEDATSGVKVEGPVKGPSHGTFVTDPSRGLCKHSGELTTHGLIGIKLKACLIAIRMTVNVPDSETMPPA